MKSFFDGLSHSDLLKMEEKDHREKVKEAVETLNYSPSDRYLQIRNKENARHDVWNMYAYGDFIKVVYLKTCSPIGKPYRHHRDNDSGIAYDNADIPEKAKRKDGTAENERFSQSLSRTRSRVFELAACNEFTYFCTFTQDQTKRDRFDLNEFRKDLAQFVRNENRSRAEVDKIKYLMIPEEHKNGGWHMHGFLKGLAPSDLRLFTLSEKLPERLRKQLREGKQIYDWTRYRRNFGYFTCTEIENGIAAAKYITKYITKDVANATRAQGAHLFFASQGLKSRDTLTWRSVEACPFDTWDFENDYVKVKEFNISDLKNTDPEKLSKHFSDC